MTRGGPRRADLAAGVPQSRVCECDRPAVLERSEGRCVKCGHRHEPDVTATTRGVAQAFAEILNR